MERRQFNTSNIRNGTGRPRKTPRSKLYMVYPPLSGEDSTNPEPEEGSSQENNPTEPSSSQSNSVQNQDQSEDQSQLPQQELNTPSPRASNTSTETPAPLSPIQPGIRNIPLGLLLPQEKVGRLMGYPFYRDFNFTLNPERYQKLIYVFQILKNAARNHRNGASLLRKYFLLARRSKRTTDMFVTTIEEMRKRLLENSRKRELEEAQEREESNKRQHTESSAEPNAESGAEPNAESSAELKQRIWEILSYRLEQSNNETNNTGESNSTSQQPRQLPNNELIMNIRVLQKNTHAKPVLGRIKFTPDKSNKTSLTGLQNKVHSTNTQQSQKHPQQILTNSETHKPQQYLAQLQQQMVHQTNSHESLQKRSPQQQQQQKQSSVPTSSVPLQVSQKQNQQQQELPLPPQSQQRTAPSAVKQQQLMQMQPPQQQQQQQRHQPLQQSTPTMPLQQQPVPPVQQVQTVPPSLLQPQTQLSQQQQAQLQMQVPRCYQYQNRPPSQQRQYSQTPQYNQPPPQQKVYALPPQQVYAQPTIACKQQYPQQLYEQAPQEGLSYQHHYQQVQPRQNQQPYMQSAPTYQQPHVQTPKSTRSNKQEKQRLPKGQEQVPKATRTMFEAFTGLNIAVEKLRQRTLDNGREPERLRTEYVNVLSLPERAAEKSTSRSKQSSNQKPVVKQQSSFPPPIKHQQTQEQQGNILPPVSQLLAIQSSTVTSRGSNASGAVMGGGNTQRVASRSFTNTFVAEAVVNNANNRGGPVPPTGPEANARGGRASTRSGGRSRGNRSTQRAEGNVTGRVARSTDGSQSQNSGKASKISNIRNLLN